MLYSIQHCSLVIAFICLMYCIWYNVKYIFYFIHGSLKPALLVQSCFIECNAMTATKSLRFGVFNAFIKPLRFLKGDHSEGYHSKRNDKQLLSFLPTTLQSLCQRKLLWSHKFFSICNVVDTQEKAHYDATLPLLKGSFTNILFLGKSHILNSNEVWYSWSINGIEPEESLNSNFVCF